ncbi:hypothetical protein E1A91_A01G035300v1 [Gossypium mustelinum]|uniref:Uncharacterized protein n=3 Tax=Gossypium TaxID=3633 RepID=A0A5J5WVQ0_GOSBA|nr:hypothetical protein ES319_A01G034200v1 [Gossypium barbadense]TYH29736.1 hypothetical protein ES288_A01G036000v1 [Gossypium darwinii]TYJ48077.1 hypothetical protein E1A91_A01G035300v1 [Gossypium mustelinum]
MLKKGPLAPFRTDPRMNPSMPAKIERKKAHFHSFHARFRPWKETSDDGPRGNSGYGCVRRMEGAYAGGGARGGHWLAECAAEA